jgi:hypothetical protein
MNLPSSSLIDTPLASRFDISDDLSTSIVFDVLDYSIPTVVEIPMNSFRLLEEVSYEVCFSLYTAAHHH